MAIQRQTGKSKPTIWHWQARFMAKGVDGLLHDATRPAGKPPLSPATIERVVEMTATHWTDPAAAQTWYPHGHRGSPAAINRFLVETNQNPELFAGTGDPDAIIEKARRGKPPLNDFGVAR